MVLEDAANINIEPLSLSNIKNVKCQHANTMLALDVRVKRDSALSFGDQEHGLDVEDSSVLTTPSGIMLCLNATQNKLKEKSLSAVKDAIEKELKRLARFASSTNSAVAAHAAL